MGRDRSRSRQNLGLTDKSWALHTLSSFIQLTLNWCLLSLPPPSPPHVQASSCLQLPVLGLPSDPACVVNTSSRDRVNTLLRQTREIHASCYQSRSPVGMWGTQGPSLHSCGGQAKAPGCFCPFSQTLPPIGRQGSLCFLERLCLGLVKSPLH